MTTATQPQTLTNWQTYVARLAAIRGISVEQANREALSLHLTRGR